MNNRVGYHLMAKPMGAACNLACEYCFYLEKKALFPRNEEFRMTDAVLEAYISKYISSQNSSEISFVWQGGEPMLAGIEFYERAVTIQKKYAGSKRIVNSMQTNGTLINIAWCDFFKKYNFFIGLSLDGPAEVHDRYRKDAAGKPTFEKVMRGLRFLQEYGIEYNVLACVARDTGDDPLKSYNFFVENGIRYVQFTPIVERLPDEESERLGLRNSLPAGAGDDSKQTVTPWSIEPIKYGDFLIDVFDQWVCRDVGSVFVMNFEWAISSWFGLKSTICIFAESCGDCAVVEHEGSVYSCDHYVYPQYKLGNVLEKSPAVLLKSKKQTVFARMKGGNLPESCKKCEVLFACRGECPRHRFDVFPWGEKNKSYLCEGYKNYFRHIHPYMKAMVQLIEHGQPVSGIMTLRQKPIVIVKK